MSPTVCYGRLSTHTGKAYNAPDDPAVGAVFPVFASEQTRTSLCSRFPETQACPPARADRAAGFQKQTPEPMRGRICALEAARAARSPCLVETRPSVCRGSLFGGTWLRKAISWGISRGIYSVPTLTVIVESDPERGADHPPPQWLPALCLGCGAVCLQGRSAWTQPHMPHGHSACRGVLAGVPTFHGVPREKRPLVVFPRCLTDRQMQDDYY